MAQTNDTHHHLYVRKRFVELQTALMIKKARSTGGGLTELTRQENIDIMVEVLSDVNLHLLACEGYKMTGTTNKFDGTEDHLIKNEALIFFGENHMRTKIDAAVVDANQRFAAGELPWNYQTVQSLIGAYPKRQVGSCAGR